MPLLQLDIWNLVLSASQRTRAKLARRQAGMAGEEPTEIGRVVKAQLIRDEIDCGGRINQLPLSLFHLALVNQAL